MTERDNYWYHLGYADGEGSMENINPNAEKWHAIEQMGFDRAKQQVLHWHKPLHIPGRATPR